MILGKVTIRKDLVVNRIGLGTNRIHKDEKSKEALKKAVSLGITFIDTASAYTSGDSEKRLVIRSLRIKI